MKSLRDNSLTIALMAAFMASLVGMALSGWAAHNRELAAHHLAEWTFSAFLLSGNFVSALFENWESEFLQMSAYVILTAFLYQRGSAESLDPDNPGRANDELPPRWNGRASILRWLYKYSLGSALAALFIVSFVFHWLGSAASASREAALHGMEARSALQYLADPELWFESFQNWQSEFLSTAVLVVLSIFLRHKGSPESKPVAAGNEETGA